MAMRAARPMNRAVCVMHLACGSGRFELRRVRSDQRRRSKGAANGTYAIRVGIRGAPGRRVRVHETSRALHAR